MKLYISYLLFLSLTLPLLVVGQQDPNHSFYNYNMNLINPAYAGNGDLTELGINFRSQWSGVVGAPETQTAFFGAPLGSQVGLGISVINDRTFVENQTSVMVDFSYRLQVGQESSLYFGLKAGGVSYKVNSLGLLTYGIGADPSLDQLEGKFNPNIGVGFLLKGESYYLNFSIPRFLTPNRLENNNGDVRLGVDKIHYYLGAGYDFDLGGNVELRPSILASYVEASPFRLDLTAMVFFNDRVGLGGGYRINEGGYGMATFKAQQWLRFGYAYTAPYESPIAKAANGSHEVFMNFIL